MFEDAMKVHEIWHKFEGFLIDSYGEDYHSELSGYEVMEKVEGFINKECPDIKIVKCDDEVYSSSFLVLVPHPKHGITIIFIPQCTTIQNHFFLYESHFKNLTKALDEMKKVYKDSL